MKTREAKSQEEIRSLLLTALKDEKYFTIWQRGLEGVLSFRAQAKLEELNEQGVMTFTFADSTGNLDDSELFFALDDITMVFKSIEFKMLKETLVVAVPTEAKYKERRRHERVRFKQHDRKDVELLFLSRIQGCEDKLIVKSQFIDVSESGACFLVSKETLKNINIELPFAIKTLTNVKIGSEKVKIMNVRKFRGATISQGEFYAIGVMFL